MFFAALRRKKKFNHARVPRYHAKKKLGRIRCVAKEEKELMNKKKMNPFIVRICMCLCMCVYSKKITP
jgi:hypothetical protein